MITFPLPYGAAGVANHLWQSTIFCSAVALAAFALRRHPARIRHLLWLCASAKFLVPFAALAGLGGALPRLAEMRRPLVPERVVAAARPFEGRGVFALPPSASLPPAPPRRNTAERAMLGLWLAGSAWIAVRRAIRWRRAAAGARRGTPAGAVRGVPAGVRILISREIDGPGVFGVFRPVLLLPEEIREWLNAAEFEAVIAHEMAHVRRRDNLWSMLQAAVETLFWFYPPVWWLGARMPRGARTRVR